MNERFRFQTLFSSSFMGCPKMLFSNAKWHLSIQIPASHVPICGHHNKNHKNIRISNKPFIARHKVAHRELEFHILYCKWKIFSALLGRFRIHIILTFPRQFVYNGDELGHQDQLLRCTMHIFNIHVDFGDAHISICM